MRFVVAVLAVSAFAVGCSSGGGRGDDRAGSALTSTSTSPPTSTTVPLPVIERGASEAERLAAARTRWEAAAIDSYTWSFQLLCFCPRLSAEVTVEDGRVVDEVIDSDTPSVPTLDITTMDELFDRVEAEIEAADEVRVEYAAETGQVVSVFVDQVRNGVDDEYTYEVRSLVPAGEERPDPAEVELTESYPCGYGFQASNTAQTVGVFLEIIDPERMPPEISELPHPRWRATFVRGEHLFANWCDDVIEPGELAPEVTATLPIIEGTITFDGPVPAADAYGERVSATVSGLVIETEDGSRPGLLDDVLVNNNWGGAAG